MVFCYKTFMSGHYRRTIYFRHWNTNTPNICESQFVRVFAKKLDMDCCDKIDFCLMYAKNSLVESSGRQIWKDFLKTIISKVILNFNLQTQKQYIYISTLTKIWSTMEAKKQVSWLELILMFEFIWFVFVSLTDLDKCHCTC